SQFLTVLRNNYAGWNNLGLCWYHVATQGAGPGDYLLADAIAQWDSRLCMKSVPPFLNRPAWDKALRSYQIAQPLSAGRLEVLNNLGNLYTVDEQWEPAEQCYQAALQSDPKYALALNNYGAMQARRGGAAADLKPARELLAQAVQLDPLLPEARYNLGEIDRATGGERNNWVENFRRYVSLAPNAPKVDEVSDLIATPGGPATDAPVAIAATAERELSLANRARLALGTQERRLVDTLAAAPDERQEGTLADTELCVWNRLGISVEMRRGAVSRVLAGRPPGLEASTLRGVRVGDGRAKVEDAYGRGRSVSRNDPYLIWMYPDVGVGFFLVESRVNKIVLFSVEGEG
ncbi:MAG: hypothetical protein HYU66_11285, partial [Armatimonadetes bacterium]|nr:hypothetical protein [Armatimonadota bacterium]